MSGALIVMSVAQRPTLVSEAQSAWPNVAGLPLNHPLVPLAHGNIPMPVNTPAAHASTLLAMPSTHPSALMAFWFAGTRESASDVQIAASHFDRATQQWSAARFLVNRQVLGEQLGFGVRRLGNPVAWLDRHGNIHLFVVSTGLGGWAAARIVHLRQINEKPDFSALTFEVTGVLPLSWLWNTSFLVRSAPLSLKDGGMVLPVHFELGIKYPVALRFNGDGEFLGMVRISSRKHLLQPTLLTISESHWLALMRDQRPNGKVAAAQTTNGGLHWTDLPDLALNNPDASVAGFALAPGRMFLAHNSSPRSRSELDLSESMDGRTWRLTHELADGSGADEFSYPSITWADNNLWVSFTDQRRRIAWQRFATIPDAH
jgi:predicted neuraminidase